MAFTASLDSLTDRDVFQTVSYDIFTRGREAYRAGQVQDVVRENGHLTAAVTGHKVKVTHTDAECSCSAGKPCAHVVAALLRWIEMRGSPRAADWAWKHYFPQGHKVEIQVDMEGSGPGLRAELATRGRKATLIVPPEEAADWLTETRNREGAQFSERVQAIRILRTPLTPVVNADFDAEGRLQLQATYTHKLRDFTPEEVGRGRVSKDWFWDGKDFYPVKDDTIQNRTLEGDEIAEFLETEVSKLSEKVVFRASPAVKAAKVLPVPTLAKVRIQTKGDWLALEPSYKSGEHVLALREILGAQRKFLRRGNDFVKVGPVQPVKPEMGRMEFIRYKQEQNLPVEAPPNLGLLTPVGPAPLPQGLKCQLRPYQRTGLDWLWFLYQNKVGGVLADDMGLGKTVQTMTLLLDIYDAGAKKPTLVVCPTSVLDHWEEKVEAFAPQLRTFKYYGPNRKALLKVAGQAKIILTTFSILASDDELGAVDWECVIVDEAQRIKNETTRCHRAARKLKARMRLALTGTPIENYIDELRAIFDFAVPGYLKESDLEDVERLKRLIQPFKLRRLKSEVLQELPQKFEDVRMCRMVPHQAALYRTLVDRRAKELLKSLESGPVDYVPIFALLGKLKRLCDHPSLVVEGSNALTSGKFELFLEILEDALRSDQKIVVFTQYLEMMDLIEAELRRRGVGFADLRGSSMNRGECLKRFREDASCRVFVCSLLAGGVGIDLTAASVVIHYDRWWNAAREEQATDRVHRLGQTRGVQVFKLVTQGTLEEKIDRMISAKKALMDSVVESDAALFKTFSREELAELLRG